MSHFLQLLAAFILAVLATSALRIAWQVLAYKETPWEALRRQRASHTRRADEFYLRTTKGEK